MNSSSNFKARGKNWTSGEDEALCLAWLDVSQDPIVSTNQKAETMYGRIHEKFAEICREKNYAVDPELRGIKGIKSRWSIINKSVSKFAGCLAQIKSRQQSGASPEDELQQALLLYNTKEKVPFNLLHCFKILEGAPKWSQHVSTKQNSTTSVKRKHSTTSKETEEEAALDLPCDETGNASGAGCTRPMGQKASKIAVASRKSLADASIAMADNGRVLANLTKQKLEDSIQRTVAYKQMVNHSIMSVDLDKMSGMAREFYMLEQTRILTETRKAAGYNVDQIGSSCSQTYEEILLEVPINGDDSGAVLAPQASANSDQNDAAETFSIPSIPIIDSDDENDTSSMQCLEPNSNSDFSNEGNASVVPSDSENESFEDNPVLQSDA